MKTTKTEMERVLEKGWAKIHSTAYHRQTGQVYLLERSNLTGDGPVFTVFNSDGLQLMGMQEFPTAQAALSALR